MRRRPWTAVLLIVAGALVGAALGAGLALWIAGVL
jgi:hypothetical protein